MLETLIIIANHWQINLCTSHWIRDSRPFSTTFSFHLSDIFFIYFSLLLIICFFSIVAYSSASTSTEAQGCINHGVINRNIVKARVKHRRQADMNTHFDWPRTWRQRTFQLAEGTSPRQALCRRPDTGWVFAVNILPESVLQQCVFSVPGWLIFFFLSLTA